MNRTLKSVAAICSALFLLLNCSSFAADHSHPTRTVSSSFDAPNTVLHVEDSTIYIVMDNAKFSASREVIGRWVERSARGLCAYFGCFPVRKLTIFIHPVPGSGITYGEARPRNGSEIILRFGVSSTEADLKNSWTLMHEMVHLGFPFTTTEQSWATEGLATYAERFIRAQIGDLSNEEAWADLKEGLPHGLPQAGDKGLDRTYTWGRVYWGGALFYLLADIKIRSKTNNKKGLPDALKEIIKEGGNFESDLSLDDAYAVGDRGTKTDVLTKLYGEFAHNPTAVDLDSLWKLLGVSSQNNHIVLDDHAPMARIRSAIQSGKALSN